MTMTFLILTVLIACSTADEDVQNNTSPIDLCDIGYDGPWEKFCDAAEIQKDYHDYPEHEMKKIRQLICQLREDNKINRNAMPAFGVYKYCLVTRPRIDEFLVKLTDTFSHKDEGKRQILLEDGPIDKNTTCYETSIYKFSKTCVEEQNPYFKMFRPLIARACAMSWLTTKDILMYIEKICANRLVSATIDWTPIFETINYRGED